MKAPVVREQLASSIDFLAHQLRLAKAGSARWKALHRELAAARVAYVKAFSA